MADFTSDFWSIYVAVIAFASVVGCGVFLKIQSVRHVGTQAKTTGHTWDGDLTERNNPLPAWWIWLFYLTIAFSIVYLILYPGLGSFAGVWGWSSKQAFDDEMRAAQAEYGPLYERYLKMDLAMVAADPQARGMGQRLFLNHCAQCHGSDAGGSRGFPNLRDKDWLYSSEPASIKASIAEGRNGIMPALAPAIGTAVDVKDVAHYVLSLSGRTHDELRAQRGQSKFAAICTACHGADGKGNPQLGAPDLTDKIWLHGGSEVAIIDTITKGRTGVMPAHKELLGDAKVHLLAAYVLGLSEGTSK